MAHKLKSFTPPTRRGGGRKPIYPWDRWLDGNTWKLKLGVDFQCSVRSMQKFIRQTASKRGITVSVFSFPDYLVIDPVALPS